MPTQTGVLKVILLGNSGVGKSTILNRKNLNEHANLKGETAAPTVGVDFVVLRGNGNKAYVWDTAGAERFDTITSQYIRSADVVICVCDNTKNSLQGLRKWVQLASTHAQSARLFLVRNKNDLHCEYDRGDMHDIHQFAQFEKVFVTGKHDTNAGGGVFDYVFPQGSCGDDADSAGSHNPGTPQAEAERHLIQ